MRSNEGRIFSKVAIVYRDSVIWRNYFNLEDKNNLQDFVCEISVTLKI